MTFRVCADTFVDDAHLAAEHVKLPERLSHRIAYVGRLSPEKRPDQAIRAFFFCNGKVNSRCNVSIPRLSI